MACIRRRSKPVIPIGRQFSAVRISAENISFKTAFSPLALGMIFMRRCSSTYIRSSRLVVRITLRCWHRHPQMRDAGFEIVHFLRAGFGGVDALGEGRLGWFDHGRRFLGSGRATCGHDRKRSRRRFFEEAARRAGRDDP